MKTAAKIILIGIGGTLATDSCSWILKLVGIHSHGLSLVGSWFIGYLGISLQHPLASQALLIGWVAHYCLGICFGFLLFFLYGKKWLESPTLSGAFVLGLVTFIISLLLIQPVLGFGKAFANMPHPGTIIAKVVLFHVVYSAGIYGSATVLKNKGIVTHKQALL